MHVIHSVKLRWISNEHFMRRGHQIHPTNILHNHFECINAHVFRLHSLCVIPSPHLSLSVTCCPSPWLILSFLLPSSHLMPPFSFRLILILSPLSSFVTPIYPLPCAARLSSNSYPMSPYSHPHHYPMSTYFRPFLTPCGHSHPHLTPCDHLTSYHLSPYSYPFLTLCRDILTLSPCSPKSALLGLRFISHIPQPAHLPPVAHFSPLTPFPLPPHHTHTNTPSSTPSPHPYHHLQTWSPSPTSVAAPWNTGAWSPTGRNTCSSTKENHPYTTKLASTPL